MVWDVEQGDGMDVKEALEIAADLLRFRALSMDDDTDEAWQDEARTVIVAFLEMVPEFGDATVSANYAERPVNTPSRILAAIREAKS